MLLISLILKASSMKFLSSNHLFARVIIDRAKYISLGIEKSLKSSLYKAFLIKSLNIGSAALTSLKFTQSLRMSNPTYTPTTKSEL